MQLDGGKQQSELIAEVFVVNQLELDERHCRNPEGINHLGTERAH